MKKLIFLDNRLLPLSKTRISPLNSAVFFGESLLETIPVYHGRPLFLREHLERLEKGCRFLGWKALPRPRFEKAIQLYTTQNTGHFAVRFCLFQDLDLPANPRYFSNTPPRLLALARPLRHDPEGFSPPSGRVGVSPWVVPGSSSVPGQFKWIFYMMIRQDFRRHPEWDEMLRLNAKGYVVDGGSSSPLWFSKGTVYVPPSGEGGLESVTRLKVLGLCRSFRIHVAEKLWKPSNVLKEGELFFVGSGVGILRVTHLQGKPLRGSSSLALRLWQHYRNLALS